MSKVNRNDPCPCNSGKKYKNCHGSDEKKSRSQVNKYILIGVAILLVLAFVFFQSGNDETRAPGEAPPGKVWSEEHGHWHDI